MVEYRDYNNPEDLKKDLKQTGSKKIPETFATTKIENESGIFVSNVAQKSLTADCWLVQFKGFEACTDCGVHLTEECGGGATLAKMIIDHFGDNVYTKMKFNAYFGDKTEGEPSFAGFLEYTDDDFAAFRFSLTKYKRHIKQLIQIAAEPKAPDLDRLYPFKAHYKQPNNQVTDESGYHQSNACNCVFTTQKGSNRDVTIEYNPEDGPDTITLYYYHQHCIMKRIGDTVWLNSAGYRTPTTKGRIDSYLRNWTLEQSKFKWYLKKWRSDERIDFYDGMEIQDV